MTGYDSRKQVFSLRGYDKVSTGQLIDPAPVSEKDSSVFLASSRVGLSDGRDILDLSAR